MQTNGCPQLRIHCFKTSQWHSCNMIRFSEKKSPDDPFTTTDTLDLEHRRFVSIWYLNKFILHISRRFVVCVSVIKCIYYASNILLEIHFPNFLFILAKITKSRQFLGFHIDLRADARCCLPKSSAQKSTNNIPHNFCIWK